MATLADRILDAIRYAPLDDDVLAKRLGVAQRQSVNQAARRLEAQGRLRRFAGPAGKIVNALPDSPVEVVPVATDPISRFPAITTGQRIASADVADALAPEPTPLRVLPSGDGARITEDEVKEAVRAHLAADGFDVAVAWGRVRGIDIDAHHPDGRRFVIEAKAEVGHNGPQQVNYFLGMLGELVQRMDDPEAVYGIALPDNRQYRGLANRLPALARERLRLAVFWVSRDGDSLSVEVDS